MGKATFIVATTNRGYALQEVDGEARGFGDTDFYRRATSLIDGEMDGQVDGLLHAQKDVPMVEDIGNVHIDTEVHELVCV